MVTDPAAQTGCHQSTYQSTYHRRAALARRTGGLW
jgi:hypothetical protein